MTAGDDVFPDYTASRRRRGVSPLLIAWILLLIAWGSLGAWLQVMAKDTALRLSMRGPRAESLILPRPPSGAPRPAPMAAAAPPTMTPPVPMAPTTPPPPKPAPRPMAPQPADAAPPPAAAPQPPVAQEKPLPPPPASPPPPMAAAQPIRPIDPSLIENTLQGGLPLAAADGRTPWRAYSAPFDASDKRPKVAIIVAGLGLAKANSDRAVDALPANIGLAFSPYAGDLQNWLNRARAAGHESYLTLALEPMNYPNSDPGPYTLLTTLSEVDNMKRLYWVLSRGQGYAGLVGEYGAGFTTQSRHVGPLMVEMRKRGLLFVDGRTTPESQVGRIARDIGAARILNDGYIDADMSIEAIDARLAELERLAKTKGQAVGLAQPYPKTVERLSQWAAGLAAKQIVLAPPSAVANLQADR